jgi:hypothetical protein
LAICQVLYVEPLLPRLERANKSHHRLFPRDAAGSGGARCRAQVRITLDKHEIAGDRRLKEPLELVHQPWKGERTEIITNIRATTIRARK